MDVVARRLRPKPAADALKQGRRWQPDRLLVRPDENGPIGRVDRLSKPVFMNDPG